MNGAGKKSFFGRIPRTAWAGRERGAMAGGSDEKGIALLLVLMMVVLLTALAAEFSLSMRTDLKITSSVIDEAEAYYLAVACFNAAAVELMQPIDLQYVDAQGNLAFSAGLVEDLEASAPPSRQIELETGICQYRIEDEDGKFPLARVQNRNTRQAAAFKEILRASGVGDEVELDTILDSLVDWVDRGTEHLLNGAEDDYYERNYADQGMPYPYEAKNRPLDTVEELLLIRGMTPEILFGSAALQTASIVGAEMDTAAAGGGYMGIYEYMTVFSRRAMPANKLTAAPAVVAALFPDEFDQIMEVRASGAPVAGSKVSQTFSIVSTGTSASGDAQRTVRAVVRRQRQLLRMVYWNDNDLAQTAASGGPEAQGNFPEAP